MERSHRTGWTRFSPESDRHERPVSSTSGILSQPISMNSPALKALRVLDLFTSSEGEVSRNPSSEVCRSDKACRIL
jgi:hypothetical protein